MKILLADDNDKYGLPFSDKLKSRGSTVDYVTNKPNLVDKARKLGYDLIITDYNMPRGIEGLEAVAEIRLFDKKTPIILCSEKFEDIPQIYREVKRAVEKYPKVYVYPKSDLRNEGFYNDPSILLR